MYKATIGRRVNAACGCSVGKSMGVNTWAGFAGADDDAIVDGDFAVAESELQRVLKSLRAGGINIVAIHQHMTGESPRILFLHYWGRGPLAALAATVKKAVHGIGGALRITSISTRCGDSCPRPALGRTRCSSHPPG